MNQAQLNAMIEEATPQERIQFNATKNVFLNTLRVKMRKQRAEAENMLEAGKPETEIKLKQEREQKCQM